MRQYETIELVFSGKAPAGSEAVTDIAAKIQKDGKTWQVKGFYAGNETYKVRFLPEECGTYDYEVTGTVLESPERGCFEIEAADCVHHGPVRAEGMALRYADGKNFTGFGTTIYAFFHQSEALIAETFDTLSKSPFNKVRLCIFPKHYNYNHNNPRCYAFERSERGKNLTFEAQVGSEVAPADFELSDGGNNWDVHHPCFEFWDAFEENLKKLEKLGIEADLILFHPYDRWGFSKMPQEDNLVYLDYLLRRLSAFPNVWWSMANEYDLCPAKTLSDWEEIEAFIAANDPYHHLLSNHNCLKPWDWSRKNTTHVSWQSKQFQRVPELLAKFRKPVLFDECRYEGNLPESWGNISGKRMVQSFWRVMTYGGHCTHGETFYPGSEEAKKNTGTGEAEVVWWARGGRLHGESPARIAFMRDIFEGFPGPLEPALEGFSMLLAKSDEEILEMAKLAPDGFSAFLRSFADMGQDERDRFLCAEPTYSGHVGDEVFLRYLDTECCIVTTFRLPESGSYRVELIDTWNMTRETVLTGVSGNVKVPCYGREYCAILAIKESEEESARV